MMSAHDYAAMSDPGRNRHFKRRWSESSNPVRHISEIAASVSDQVAKKAIAFWLQQALDLDGQEREAAFKAADDVRRAAKLHWGVFMEKDAA